MIENNQNHDTLLDTIMRLLRAPKISPSPPPPNQSKFRARASNLPSPPEISTASRAKVTSANQKSGVSLDQPKRASVEAWFRYSDELGLGPYYRDRAATQTAAPAPGNVNINGNGNGQVPVQVPAYPSENYAPAAARTAQPAAQAMSAQAAPGRSPAPSPAASGAAATQKFAAPQSPIQVAPGASLFDERIEGDTLELIREAIGANCTRCKLHKARTKIVFGVGNPKAELVFVGEGPGHDEDIQGEPFVGRAGKLLTQMIEAMGLRREDVYICNVVKCRPPENRLPEKDEITTCSPFLMRQLAAIQPKVICTLGSCASQTLLQTTQGISRFRGEWFDFQGSRLIATYHPAYLLRNPAAKSEVWKDLQKVMAHLGLKSKRK
jgi:DNA polymerase